MSAAADASAPTMNGNVIDGKAVAARIRVEVAQQVADMKAKYNRVRRAACLMGALYMPYCIRTRCKAESWQAPS
jgi:hypothetical protein